ncbi:MAG: site-specific integrase, partial [Gammaproteobacteria bacterium]|nr:site-specific integrase [Gammaproteobacteria bacterium]
MTDAHAEGSAVRGGPDDPQLTAFLHTLHGKSPHTRSNYARDLRALRGFLSDQRYGGWKDLDAHALRAFVAWQH